MGQCPEREGRETQKDVRKKRECGKWWFMNGRAGQREGKGRIMKEVRTQDLDLPRGRVAVGTGPAQLTDLG